MEQDHAATTPMTASFADMARPALALAGRSLSEEDLGVLAAVAQALEPGMRVLEEADLRELPIESDLDPARAPSGAA